MKILLILLLTFTFTANAVTPIKAGQTAPHDGYIFTKAEEKKVRQIREERIKLEDLVVKKNKKIEIQAQRIDILNRRLENSKVSTVEKVLWFVGGVFLVGGSVYLAGQLRR